MGSSICPCWERNERKSVEATVGTYGPNCTELLSWALKFAGCQTWWCTSVIQLSEGRRMSLLRPSWISLERLHFEQNRTLYAREPLVQPCILSCCLAPCDEWAVLTFIIRWDASRLSGAACPLTWPVLQISPLPSDSGEDQGYLTLIRGRLLDP